MTQVDSDYLDMPDDEIMGMSTPASSEAPVVPGKTPTDPVIEQVASDQIEASGLADGDAAQTPVGGEGGEGNEGGEGAPVEQVDPLSAADDLIPDPAVAKPAEVKDPAAAQPPAGDPATDPAKAAGEPATNEPPKEPTQEDLKAFYDRILGQPLKANGKMIQLRSPDEVEQAVKMGLNYTKKMQAWQPRMRVVKMLENNGLLDEAKLNHLIDLSKGDPLAIQKLLADSKFDPISIDADQAASYTPGNHQVSDDEIQLSNTLDELESSTTGAELILEVAKQWDGQSKQAAIKDPSILLALNEHKANGLYAVITQEMDHLRTLGQLTDTVPFLQAYRAVGDMLHEQGRLGQGPQKQPDPTPVETRVATPAPKVTNSEKAAAASPTKASPAAAKTEENFLDIPDDQFLKQMQGRL